MQVANAARRRRNKVSIQQATCLLTGPANRASKPRLQHPDRFPAARPPTHPAMTARRMWHAAPRHRRHECVDAASWQGGCACLRARHPSDQPSDVKANGRDVSA
eukprot:365990-Chlamydomonas_euryale.AAC.32